MSIDACPLGRPRHRAARRLVRSVATGLVLGLAVTALATSVVSAAGPADPAGAPVAAASAPVAPAVPVPSAPSRPVVAPVTTGLSAFDTQILTAVNAQRSAVGVAPVVEAKGITGLSATWSKKLAMDGALSHNADAFSAVLTSGAAQRTTFGENVASWTDASATGADVVNTYLTNVSNRANVLDPAFKFIGIDTESGSGGSRWSTTTFVDAVDADQTFDPALRSIPIGQLNAASVIGSTVRVSGWGYDPDTATSPIQVKLTDQAPNGSTSSTVTANVTRDDVAQQYPNTGNTHGFTATLPLAGTGTHQICATLLNAGSGSTNPDLGCLPVTVGGPIGAFDSVALTGTTASVAGWAVDQDDPARPSTVIVSDQGPTGTITYPALTADQNNTNVDAAIPGVGAQHGFSGQIVVKGVGSHTICVSAPAISSAAPAKDLGCKSVVIAGPTGAITAVSNTTTAITLTGWAQDPNVPAQPTSVQVKVTAPNGAASTLGPITANQASSGASDPNHGFSVNVPTTQFGSYQLCVSARSLIDNSASADLGCRMVVVSDIAGWLDAVAVVNGSVQAKGWTLDQATPTGSTQVTITVTGPSGTKTVQGTANGSRADIGRVYPGAGNLHGYTVLVPTAGSGVNKVCAGTKAINNATTRELRCVTIAV